MNDVAETGVEIKAVRDLLNTQQENKTALAQLIALHMANGISTVAELSKLTGYTERAIRKARTELGCRNPGAAAEPQCRNQGATEPEFRNPGAERNPSAGTPVPEASRVVNNTSLTSLEDRLVSEVSVSPPVRSPKRKTETKQGTRLAEDWTLPGDWRDWARVTCPAASAEMIDREGLKFGNHWQAKAGQQARKLNWFKTWQNWCLTAFATAPTRPQANAPHWIDERREKNRKFLEMVRNLPAGGVAQ